MPPQGDLRGDLELARPARGGQGRKRQGPGRWGAVTVYVDDMRARFGRMIMCQTVGDDEAELHEMARRMALTNLPRLPDLVVRLESPIYISSVTEEIEGDRA